MEPQGIIFVIAQFRLICMFTCIRIYQMPRAQSDDDDDDDCNGSYEGCQNNAGA